MVKSGFMWLKVVLCGKKRCDVVTSGSMKLKVVYIIKSGFMWKKVV